MHEFIAFEKHTFAVCRRDGLYMILMVYTQFSAICWLPIVVQVHNYGKGAAFIALKLIEVFFVKTADIVPGIVKFISRNARVARLIEQLHEQIHLVKKSIFMRVVVAAVEPVNLIFSDQLVIRLYLIVANTCGVEMLPLKKGDEIRFQVGRERRRQKMLGNPDFVFHITVNQHFKSCLHLQAFNSMA